VSNCVGFAAGGDADEERTLTQSCETGGQRGSDLRWEWWPGAGFEPATFRYSAARIVAGQWRLPAGSCN